MGRKSGSRNQVHLAIPNRIRKHAHVKGTRSALKRGEVKVACHARGRPGRLTKNTTKYLDMVTCEHCVNSHYFREAQLDE